MDTALHLPTMLIRDLVNFIEEPIEDAITAHGFSFSALTADHEGARLCYSQAQAGAMWRLIIQSSADQAPSLILEQGTEAKPSLSLRLALDGGPSTTLADALRIAMTLFSSLDQT
jgi:hypothetical protein